MKAEIRDSEAGGVVLRVAGNVSGVRVGFNHRSVGVSVEKFLRAVAAKLNERPAAGEWIKIGKDTTIPKIDILLRFNDPQNRPCFAEYGRDIDGDDVWHTDVDDSFFVGDIILYCSHYAVINLPGEVDG